MKAGHVVLVTWSFLAPADDGDGDGDGDKEGDEDDMVMKSRAHHESK
jgi:hypothetical protein